MPSAIRAAHLRLAREPGLLDSYEPGMWAAFAGETVVAASHDLDEVHRILDAAGVTDPLIVPVLPDPFIG